MTDWKDLQRLPNAKGDVGPTVLSLDDISLGWHLAIGVFTMWHRTALCPMFSEGRGFTVRDIHSFIHSGHFYSAPFKSSTTQRRSRLQHGYCIGVSRRSAQATAGKGPYVTARAGVQPTTLRLRVIASTNAPSRPKICCWRLQSRSKSYFTTAVRIFLHVYRCPDLSSRQ